MSKRNLIDELLVMSVRGAGGKSTGSVDRRSVL